MWLNLSQTELKLSGVNIRSFKVFGEATGYQENVITVSKGGYQISSIPINGQCSRYAGVSVARAPSAYATAIAGIVVAGKSVSTIPLTSFMKPELLNIHKVLAPLYVLFAIFGSVLVANIGIISTAIGFYQFIANLGIFLTIASAIVLLWHTFKNL